MSPRNTKLSESSKTT